jgi:hypothetical protein
VQLGIVLDAHRSHVDEAADAGRPHRGDDRPGPHGVDQAEARAAVAVARDCDEVDDGVDAGQRRRQRGGFRDVGDADLDPGPIPGREAIQGPLAGSLRPG